MRGNPWFLYPIPLIMSSTRGRTDFIIPYQNFKPTDTLSKLNPRNREARVQMALIWSSREKGYYTGR